MKEADYEKVTEYVKDALNIWVYKMSHITYIDCLVIVNPDYNTEDSRYYDSHFPNKEFISVNLKYSFSTVKDVGSTYEGHPPLLIWENKLQRYIRGVCIVNGLTGFEYNLRVNLEKRPASNEYIESLTRLLKLKADHPEEYKIQTLPDYLFDDLLRS